IVVDADERARAIVAEARAAAAKREREAGLAETEKIGKLNQEIARLTVRSQELKKILKGLSQMATSSFDEFPDDDQHHSLAEHVEAVAGDLDDDTVVASDDTSDADDVTRVQPAVSGGRNR
ncbi:hypothetical protein WB334_26140, partial [Escherichia coli]|uniref:hypothetical protein n=1 Tax=Escherichia coli TaxID=562 RepID=UPI00215845AF